MIIGPVIILYFGVVLSECNNPIYKFSLTYFTVIPVFACLKVLRISIRTIFLSALEDFERNSERELHKRSPYNRNKWLKGLICEPEPLPFPIQLNSNFKY